MEKALSKRKAVSPKGNTEEAALRDWARKLLKGSGACLDCPDAEECIGEDALEELQVANSVLLSES